MNDPKEFIEQTLSSIKTALPSNLADDMKSNINAVVSRYLQDLDVVSREEFDVQTSVLLKAQATLKELEEKLNELESKIG